MYHIQIGWVFVLYFCSGLSSARFFSSDKQICESTGSKVLSYSGFKIHRQYVVKDLKPPMLHFVSLSHCNHGNVDYERLTRTGRETDVEWDKPMCMIVPKSMKDFHATQENQTGSTRHKIPFLSNIIKKPHSVTPSSNIQKNTSEKRLLKNTFNDFVRKISSKMRFIEYNDDSLSTDLEDLHPISYNNLSLSDLDDLKCFKLARRKKYALRKMMLYAPYTWVGGIFDCEISNDTKLKYLKSLTDSRDFIKPFEFVCDSQHSTPLFPLLADDVTSQWIEREKGVTISQRIPYLYSPGLLDFRYGKPSQALRLKSTGFMYEDHLRSAKDKLPFDSWTNELEVNENYNYTNDDINAITKAITESSNLLNNYLTINSRFIPWEWDKKELIGNNNDTILFLEHKFLSSITHLKSHSLSNEVLKKTQELWDDVSLTIDKFGLVKTS